MKKALILLAAVLLLACTCSAPSLIPPSVTATYPIASVEPDEPAVQADFTVVQLHPRGGNLIGKLHNEALNAAALGQRMFVEFDASWCPSCRVISQGLAEGKSAQFLAAFDGLYLIQLDTDEWGWGVPEAGFEFDAIPVFFRLDESGDPTGDWIDGGAWGEDTYENIANVMGAWFHQP